MKLRKAANKLIAERLSAEGTIEDAILEFESRTGLTVDRLELRRLADDEVEVFLRADIQSLSYADPDEAA